VVISPPGEPSAVTAVSLRYQNLHHPIVTLAVPSCPRLSQLDYGNLHDEHVTSGHEMSLRQSQVVLSCPNWMVLINAMSMSQIVTKCHFGSPKLSELALALKKHLNIVGFMMMTVLEWGCIPMGSVWYKMCRRIFCKNPRGWICLSKPTHLPVKLDNICPPPKHGRMGWIDSCEKHRGMPRACPAV
jgi:hypothetical protein